jgi:isopenicillin N synthase-like dioxygenase
MTSFQIPIIDFTIYQTDAKQQFAHQIRQTCETAGLLYLQNPLSQSLVERLFEQSRLFFNLPAEIKRQVRWSQQTSNRGYVEYGHQAGISADPKEAFDFGRELILDQPSLVASELGLSFSDQLDYQNFWQQFIVTAHQCFQNCTEVVNQILEAIAIAFGAPADFFAAHHHYRDHSLRLLHYPPLSGQVGATRAGAHSDFSTLTLLFQDQTGGLEVYTEAAGWVEAPAVPNAVLVNIGEFLQLWTDCTFRATPHRVVAKTEAMSRQSRYSIAFFCDPNRDTEVCPLQSKQSKPSKQPLLVRDYLIKRQGKLY